MTDDDRLPRLRALADLRRWPELEVAARQALADHPGRADVVAHLARALLLQDRPAEAVEVARAGLADHPDDDWLGRVLTSAYVAAGDLAAADEEIARLLARTPASYHVRVLAARVALRRLHLDDARLHGRAAVQADGARAGGYVMLAAALTQSGAPLEAEDVARRGLAVDPGSGDLHCQLAVALERTGRRSEAARHWVEAGRVGRYPEVAVEGLRQLMAEGPQMWLWAVVAVVALVVASVGIGLVVADPWTSTVVAVATAAVATLVIVPVLGPRVRRRRRNQVLSELPPAAQAALGIAGGDERV